jgi:uncharacterized protein YbgA (DUF1722 family)
MAGYFKNRLDAASTRELGEVIDDYRRGLVPLIVPLTLVRHHVRIHDVRYRSTSRASSISPPGAVTSESSH